ncbi:hypothetical protein E2C01_101781 [Portunus trituberculatus]|uniref:Uncharacterized protein n=1 Tax=Portunus trituberculatus TaxID=210409 RepID=A0A5B7KGQ7_PORTR|nr:hypothetical protein [Portunus trituberculatus]
MFLRAHVKINLHLFVVIQYSSGSPPRKLTNNLSQDWKIYSREGRQEGDRGGEEEQQQEEEDEEEEEEKMSKGRRLR